MEAIEPLTSFLANFCKQIVYDKKVSHVLKCIYRPSDNNPWMLAVQIKGLFNSIAYGLNSAVRRAIAERIDMYFPEKLKRLLPQRFKVQQEQELAALFVEG
ncbi:hypothetical protein HPP92_015567 [Vanilla planifolia]|uniref:Uncharacterized protein n=1 Tax=Vanilla planifolia TaxID=51239 RepID=A0A835QD91_VANPL|nr:hypothetical protein HPP92_015567 [Vanilla planifolia]